ncbi:hypothetical protein SDRG_07722 [Saprolegnia diclina VS20]|uniref:Uncharacterized protein n=1 Tax=Saprolegnia diclina (strain VS20) TaxID=1156394 RepID=T0QAK8_SAPDV|nr:hypothetical protein SDRG_07722 [Saprolegnia diclina VS20]EQC34924.1 hypothetical protein SDRG_07722 [Saprolegnia diclina VS20]|eukprot:XP_008611796.1 hypothetical protein SDRG_07722 [Saprolegnia diclina VS20]
MRVVSKVVDTDGFAHASLHSTKAQTRFLALMSNHRSDSDSESLQSKCSKKKKKKPLTTDSQQAKTRPTPASSCDVHTREALRQEELHQEELRPEELRREEQEEDAERQMATERDDDENALQRNGALLAPPDHALLANFANDDAETASEDIDAVVQPAPEKRKTTRKAPNDDEHAKMFQLMLHELRDERQERMELARTMEHERMMLALQSLAKIIEARSNVNNV